MIDKINLAHIDHAYKIRDNDKMHREKREFELFMRRLQLTKENPIC